MTIYQLQLDVWADVQKLSKPYLISTISKLNTVQNGDYEANMKIERKYVSIVIISKDIAFEKIKTTDNKDVWSKIIRPSSRSEGEENADTHVNID